MEKESTLGEEKEKEEEERTIASFEDGTESQASSYLGRRSPIYNTPSFLAKVYDMNYLDNLPSYENVEDDDLTDMFASLKSLNKDTTQEQCKKDAIVLSKNVCNQFKDPSIPLFEQDERLQVMEEEIRANFIGFVELCIDQVSAPTKVFEYVEDDKNISTKYGKNLALYNRPVPKFWC
uniref:Uncharacterized protein n=1 Tax=Panagrolaimus sp. PS1159 TaxID=55785 RepID=A0AC35GI72_9BILA